MNAFRLLSVAAGAGELHATIASATLLTGDDLNRDFRLLSAFRSKVVRLDLRAVRHIDDKFLASLIVLHKDLKLNGTRLIVAASQELVEVMRITKLDKLLEVGTEQRDGR